MTEPTLDDVILVLNDITDRVEALEKAQNNILVWLRKLSERVFSLGDY
jgi:hypothetical protein